MAKSSSTKIQPLLTVAAPITRPPSPAVVVTALLVLMCGSLVSCGPDKAVGPHGDGHELAERIVATDRNDYPEPYAAAGALAEQRPPPELARTDCELTITTDEYGFETETITCTGDQAAGATLAAGEGTVGQIDSARAKDLLEAPGWLDPGLYRPLVDTVPSGPAADQMAALADHLDRLDAACGVDLKRWQAELADYISAAGAVAEVLTVEQLGDYQGSIQANALARSLVERALMQSGCVRPDPNLVPPSDDLLKLTSAAVTATVTIDNRLRNSSYGPLFHLFSSLPNYQWMRNDPTPVTTVLLGTSQLGAAVDVAEMNRQFDTEIGSAWIPGALAEVQAIWVDEVLHYANPQQFIWFVGPLDLFVECDTTKRGVEFQTLLDARANTLARGFVVGDDPVARILGPVDPGDTVRGDGIKREGYDAEGTKSHRDSYLPGFKRGQFCDQRARIIADTVDRLKADGREVIVVGMPVHPELRVARPDTAEQLEMFRQRYLGDRVPFVDLTATVTDENLWSDFTHVTSEGATEFTDQLVTALRNGGLS